MAKLTKDAIGAIAFILMTDAGIDAVDACNVLENAQAANQLARAVEDECDHRRRMSFIQSRGRAEDFVEILKTGWLPEGWQS